MHLLRKDNANKFIFLSFIFLHIILFSVNVAEWGDSYRILRAAEFIRNFSYPTDEKRPPLFSIILAIRPEFVDQVFWGRIIMFIFSVFSFWVFSKLCDQFFKKDSNEKKVALLLFMLNPVYLYWSLRIMADVPFSFLLLLSIYFYTFWRESLSFKRLFFLGVCVGLAVLMRFEGYILFGAIGLGLFFNIVPHVRSGIFFEKIYLNARRLILPLLEKVSGKSMDDMVGRVRQGWKGIFVYVSAFFLTIVPYLYYRNPFSSSYLEEPSGRKYDLEMVLIYLFSVLFLFGFIYAFFFLMKGRRKVMGFFLENTPILVLILSGLFVLLWPAAVPRLFTPLIPLFIFPLSISICAYFEDSEKRYLENLFFLCPLLVLYVLAQFYLRLQFLVPIKEYFVFIVLIQGALIYTILKKQFSMFLVLLIGSMFVWSVACIHLHKDIFKSVKAGAEYASENLAGRLGYNDVSSVSDWYLNQRSKKDGVEGIYFGYGKKEDLDYENLLEKDLDYLLMTNEHNTDMTLDIEKRSYLEQIQEFRYLINGKVFFTKIIRVL